MRRHHPDRPELVEGDAAALKADAAAEEFIRLIVDGFPPLTAEQRTRSRSCSEGAAMHPPREERRSPVLTTPGPAQDATSPAATSMVTDGLAERGGER